jgi:hypothetical protein
VTRLTPGVGKGGFCLPSPSGLIPASSRHASLLTIPTCCPRCLGEVTDHMEGKEGTPTSGRPPLGGNKVSAWFPLTHHECDTGGASPVDRIHGGRAARLEPRVGPRRHRAGHASW